MRNIEDYWNCKSIWRWTGGREGVGEWGGRDGASPREGILFKTEKCEEASWNLLKFCLSFGGVWKVVMRKNWECNRKKLVSEMWGKLIEGGLWKYSGSLHVWRYCGNCLYQTLGPSWEVRLAGIGLRIVSKGVSD